MAKRGHPTRKVGDAGDLETQRVERAHGGFTAGTGTLDAHFQILHPAFLRRAAGMLGSHLGGNARFRLDVTGLLRPDRAAVIAWCDSVRILPA